jgi:outer membrane protein insertion porin family
LYITKVKLAIVCLIFSFGILSCQKAIAVTPDSSTPLANSKLNQYFGKNIVSEVRISNNRLLTDLEILDEVLTVPGSTFSREMIMADLQKIYQLGYFEADGVEAIPYLKSDNTILLEYRVRENAPINDLVIYGNTNTEELNAYYIFSDLVGKPENAKLLKDKIQELETEYLKNGFIIAKVTDIDLNEAGVLTISVDEGIIKTISYKGNEKTKETFLGHLVKDQAVNEPYNEFKFANDFKRLQASNYFSSVTRTVKPSTDASGGYDLQIGLVEKRTASVGLGGGVNSTAGIFGNASLNLGNLRGKGETLNVTALLGSGFGAAQTIRDRSRLVRNSNTTQVSANYSMPYFLDSDYGFNTFVNLSKGPNFNVDLSRQTAFGGGFGLSRVVGRNHVFRLNTTGNYIDIQDKDRKEYLDEVTDNIIRIDNLSPRDILKKKGEKFTGGARGIARAEAKELRDGQIVSGVYLGIKPSYTYNKLDDRQNPRDGWKTRINAEPVYGFGDISSFTKLDGSATKYLPIGKESSFLLNFRGGSQLLGDIPQFAIYRLGTASGIRGYRQFSELGVGSHLAITTAEFRTPIYHVIPPLKKYNFTKKVDFALFADAGIIGGDIRLNRVTERLSQAAAVGFGIRVKLPLVGALRFDLGFPLVEVLTGNSSLFRFNFGPADIF